MLVIDNGKQTRMEARKLASHTRISNALVSREIELSHYLSTSNSISALSDAQTLLMADGYITMADVVPNGTNVMTGMSDATES